MAIPEMASKRSGFESRQLPQNATPSGAPKRKGDPLSRFNTSSHRTKPAVALTTSPIATVSKTPDTLTFEGAAGWTRTAKGELYLRSVGAFQDGKSDFYEKGKQRDDRLRQLVAQIVDEDAQWGVEFVTYLRGPGNMRTAPVMIACDFVHERLKAGRYDNGLNRKIINAACQRADEPGELLAYWTSMYGRRIPKPVKRGVADAVRRLYTEYTLLKYDTDSKAYRFGDILNLVHAVPDPDKPWQGDLFKYALDRRHHPDSTRIPESLNMIRENSNFRKNVAKAPVLLTSPTALKNAGFTWEDALSLAGQYDVEKVKVWEATIPIMPIMSQVKNLCGFDRAGVSDKTARLVIDRLTNPEVIAKSRMFPFRFLSAYRATKKEGSLRWLYPLEQALNHSLANVPSLDKRTLILVDRSPSMFPEYDHMFPNPKIKDISRADQAAIFGSALAVRAENPTLVEFHGGSREIEVKKGTSVLPLVEEFGMDGATDIPSAIRRHYANHDRVIILTDEQTKPGYLPSNSRGWVEHTPIDTVIPLDVPVFMWNFAGYTASAMASGSNARFTLGGLTDDAFRLIPLLESGAAGVWPWELTQGS